MDKKLERNPQNKTIAGVASGLADYFDVDVTLVRILFVVAVVFGFFGILLYIILWVAVPERHFFKGFPDLAQAFSTPFEKSGGPFDKRSEYQVPPLPPQEKKTDSGRLTAGLLLIAVGAYFMLAEFNLLPDWFSILKLWPLALVALGLAMMFGARKKKPSLPPVINWDDKAGTEVNPKINDQPFT